MWQNHTQWLAIPSLLWFSIKSIMLDLQKITNHCVGRMSSKQMSIMYVIYNIEDVSFNFNWLIIYLFLFATVLACDQFSLGTISRQCIVTPFYQHLKLYTKNDVTMHWQEMVLGEKWSHAISVLSINSLWDDLCCCSNICKIN